MIIFDSDYLHFKVNQSDIVEVWKRFTDKGKTDSHLLPSAILSSWERCLELKVDPWMRDLDLPVAGDFLKRLESKNQFFEAAVSYVTRFYRLAEQSDFVFAILDEQGLILELIGDRDRVRRLKEEYSITRGVTINERTTGTTATYLSLLINRSVQTVGAEHYLRRFHHITDSAAPIRDAHGKIIGALSMTAQNIDYAHPHTLGMVTSLADAIGAQVRRHQMRQYLEQYLESFDENREKILEYLIDTGLLEIDRGGRIWRLNDPAADQPGLPPDRPAGTAADVLQPVPEIGKKEFYRKHKTRGRSEAAIPGAADRPGKAGTAMMIPEGERYAERDKRKKAGEEENGFNRILGRSGPLLKAVTLARKASRSTSAVLLLGESGTGKELFARAIHSASPARGGPFVSVNCAAIPKELVGTELFGYEEGAFTGAKRGGNAGKFELADGGTIFLDEIGEMPLEIQGSLLRVLEEKTITRIGGNRRIPVNVRIIAATNRRLREEALAGQFRLDLFFRLNVFAITLPPLRERPEDIPLLVECFVARVARSSGKNIRGFTPAAMKVLCRYDWPGNVRELSNVIERAVYLGESDYLDVKDLPEEVVGNNMSGEILTVRNYEKEKIGELLNKFKGNKTRVAATLGISRATLYRRLKEYGMCSTP